VWRRAWRHAIIPKELCRRIYNRRGKPRRSANKLSRSLRIRGIKLIKAILPARLPMSLRLCVARKVQTPVPAQYVSYIKIHALDHFRKTMGYITCLSIINIQFRPIRFPNLNTNLKTHWLRLTRKRISKIPPTTTTYSLEGSVILIVE
jgi:hypothetical protein